MTSSSRRRAAAAAAAVGVRSGNAAAAAAGKRCVCAAAAGERCGCAAAAAGERCGCAAATADKHSGQGTTPAVTPKSPTMASSSEINPSPDATAPTVGLSSTASTNGVAAEASDPAWKHCTMPDVNKKNSLKCNYCGNTYHGGITRMKYHLGKVPKCGVAKCTDVLPDVQEEMIKLLSKKLDNKDRKNREKEEDRAEVDLSYSEGEEQSDAHGNSVIVLKKVTKKGASSGGPMDKYCKLTPEEVLAARKGKSSAVEKVQSKLSL